MFQAFMNHIFQDMTDIFVVIYLDDILIFSDSLEDHWVHVQCILEHLCEYNLHSKPEKCLFHMQKIEFLGFIVTPTGISMDSTKTDTVSVWLTPTNFKAVQAFLRFANFYRQFIVGFSEIVIPLIRLTCKDNHSPGAPTTPRCSKPSRQLSLRPPSWHISTLTILLLLRLMLLTMQLLKSSPRSPPMMATSTQSHSTHAACSQWSSTTRSTIRNCSQYSRPSDNGATTSRALHMSCSCSPITRTSNTSQPPSSSHVAKSIGQSTSLGSTT